MLTKWLGHITKVLPWDMNFSIEESIKHLLDFGHLLFGEDVGQHDTSIFVEGVDLLSGQDVTV